MDREDSPTVIEAMFREVDWPAVHREGQGVEILVDCEARAVDCVGYGIDGSPLVHLGRVVLDDLQVKLSKMGWRTKRLPGRRRGRPRRHPSICLASLVLVPVTL